MTSYFILYNELAKIISVSQKRNCIYCVCVKFVFTCAHAAIQHSFPTILVILFLIKEYILLEHLNVQAGLLASLSPR